MILFFVELLLVCSTWFVWGAWATFGIICFLVMLGGGLPTGPMRKYASDVAAADSVGFWGRPNPVSFWSHRFFLNRRGHAEISAKRQRTNAGFGRFLISGVAITAACLAAAAMLASPVPARATGSVAAVPDTPSGKARGGHPPAKRRSEPRRE